MNETDFARIKEQITQLLETGQRSTTAEFELQTADGGQKIVENRLAVIGDQEFRGTAGVLRDITDRIERRQQLESFQQAIEKASDGIAVLEDDEYVYVDETHVEMYGFEQKEDLLGKTWRELYDDEEVERLETDVFPQIQTEGDWRGSVTGKRPNGSTFPADLSLSVVDDSQLVCTVRDATDRQRREQQQRKTVDVLERMYEVTTDADRVFSEKIDALLDVGTDFLDLPYGYLTRIEEDDAGVGTQTIIQARGDHEHLQPGETCPLPQSYCRKALAGDGLVTVLNAGEEGWEADPAYDTFSLEAYIGGSVAAEDDIYGTVCFASSERKTEQFTPTERSFVSLLRRWIGYELDRQTAQTELFEEREQFRLLINSIDEYAYILLDEDGTIQTWNKGAQQLFGHDETEAIGSQVGCLYPNSEGDPKPVERFLEQARVAGESRDEGWYAKADDSTFYAEVRYASLEADDGSFRGYATVVRDLTEQRRQQRRTERLVEESDDVVTIVDTDGSIEYTSGSATRVLGYSSDDMTDENLFDYVHSDGRQRVMEAFYNAVEQPHESKEEECRFRSADGDLLNLEVTVRNMLDDDAIGGMLLYLRDVTDAKRRARRFESIFNQTFQFTGILDPDGTVVEANEAALEFGGITREEIVGTPFYNALWWNHSQEVYDRVRDGIERAAEGEFVRYETEVRGVNGLATIDFSIKPVTDEDGHVVLLVVEGRDMTMQQRRRQHLGVMQRVMRHNIRNDLNKVYGWAELMCDETDQRSRRSHFERIDQILQRWRSMTERVKEIREILEADTDGGMIQPLTDLVAECASTIREEHPSVTVNSDIDNGTSAEISTEVQKAVTELMRNAAKATDDGVVEVMADKPTDGWIEIEIQDNGPGMPDIETEVLETGQESPLTHGQGLGLWMVRMLVTQAGGDITVAADQTGTSVSLRLPTDLEN